MKKKILLIGNVGFTITNFRSELIEDFLKNDFEVVVVCKKDIYCAAFKDLNITYYDIPLKRHGINPFFELKTFNSLRRIIKKERPDIVVNYTIKPNIYGSIAAWMNRVPVICSNITGLGFVFTGRKFGRKIFRQLIKPFYYFALKTNKLVFFENKDDGLLFEKLKLVSREKMVFINGAGVNTDRFFPQTIEKEEASFILVSRLLWDKGIREYVEASRILKQKYKHAKFYLLGPFDDNPSAIPKHIIETWEKEGVINYLGSTTDVRPFLAKSMVSVLPSYREGTPRALLESMAMGLAVVTTDVPGCRDTVDPGVNGYLVEAENSLSLSLAMEKFILNPELANQMGLHGVELIKQKYDIQSVNRTICENLNGVTVQ